MKLLRFLVAALAGLVLASCASVHSRKDALCSEIAAFANQTEVSGTHEVALTTVWGPTPQYPDSLFYKNCDHGEYEPGKRLCQYLMANTSTEFPQHNFRRVLACLNGQKSGPPKYVSIERIETLMWGVEVPGVRPEVTVGVAFADGAGKTPVLKVIARADQP
ncbi:hypothetical protein K7B09_12965 [Thermomonas sp. RSS23]|uniref:Lipoprotein n=1 Tax=Thermomonas beijingensis TaxID=2872701 RepID=A0ABS7TH90_9GAMM|nr:hypothetical protein [Thermomonas beijingensis]MBZ4187233.1 hypothetical protein [Thermomonas beijingensis]